MAEEYNATLDSLDGIDFDEPDDFDDPEGDDSVRDQDIINTAWDDPNANTGGETVSADELARYKDYERVVNQFNSNPVQAMQQLAQQVGMELRPVRDAAAPAAPSGGNVTGSSMEQEIEGLIEDDSLKFLAPIIAKVSNAIAEKRLKDEVEPLKASQKEILTRNRQQEYAFAAGELAKRHPDWSQHEQDMQGRLEFVKTALNGGPLIHHKYGNLLELMYNWAAGRNDAVRRVAADYRDAPRQRTPSSSTSQSGQPDILQLVAKERDPRKAERMAFDDAVRRVIG
jgi:hypothetical protein